MGTVRIIKHEAIPGCGSFEVRYADDRPASIFTGMTYSPSMLRHASSPWPTKVHDTREL